LPLIVRDGEMALVSCLIGIDVRGLTPVEFALDLRGVSSFSLSYTYTGGNGAG